MTGLFSALVMKGRKVIGTTQKAGYYRAFEAAFRMLRESESLLGFSVDFRIVLHDIHGDSSTVDDGVTAAVGRRLAILDDREQKLRLTITVERARAILDQGRFRGPLFPALADAFVEALHA